MVPISVNLGTAPGNQVAATTTLHLVRGMTSKGDTLEVLSVAELHRHLAAPLGMPKSTLQRALGTLKPGKKRLADSNIIQALKNVGAIGTKAPNSKCELITFNSSVHVLSMLTSDQQVLDSLKAKQVAPPPSPSQDTMEDSEASSTQEEPNSMDMVDEMDSPTCSQVRGHPPSQPAWHASLPGWMPGNLCVFSKAPWTMHPIVPPPKPSMMTNVKQPRLVMMGAQVHLFWRVVERGPSHPLGTKMRMMVNMVMMMMSKTLTTRE